MRQHQSEYRVQLGHSDESTPVVELVPGQNDISALYSGPIREREICLLVERLSEAVRYYRYDLITLALNSPGGDAQALKHWFSFSATMAHRGVLIQTRALSDSSSAAAVMLSLGALGNRSVQRHSRLVYHFARVASDKFLQHVYQQGDGHLTAQSSRKAATELRALEQRIAREDSLILEALDEHIGFNRGIGFASRAIGHRVEAVKKWLEHCSCDTSEIRKTLNRITKANDWARAAGVEVSRVFQRDEAVHPTLAYLLLLIDRIEGLTGLESDK